MDRTYRRVAKAGEGGTGTVLKVEDEQGNTYALKYLKPESVSSARTRRFKNELFFCLKNEHKNIIKVLDHGFIGLSGKKCPFYVSRFYPETLRRLMQGPIPHDEVLTYYAKILEGVGAAHRRGTWHRDLKPENILCDPSSEELVVADFGIAHFAEELLQTIIVTGPQERLANFRYAAPEQKTRGGTVHARADIYALGMILNEMFTGKTPSGTRFKMIKDGAADYGYLDDLVDLMMRHSPEERPKTIEEVQRQLLARRNIFASQQETATLQQTVVPEYDIDDPLVREPVRLVDCDYRGGWLKLVVNQIVELYPRWIRAFHSISGWQAVPGHEPNTFEFRGNSASAMLVGEMHVQRVIDYFKDYLEKANRDYEEMLREEKRKQEETERVSLQKRLEEEEARQRVLRKIKI